MRIAGSAFREFLRPFGRKSTFLPPPLDYGTLLSLQIFSIGVGSTSAPLLLGPVPPKIILRGKIRHRRATSEQHRETGAARKLCMMYKRSYYLDALHAYVMIAIESARLES